MKTNALRLIAIAVGVAAVGCGEENTDFETKSSALTTWCPAMAADQICVCTDPSGYGSCQALTLQSRFYTNLSTFPTNTPLGDIRYLNDRISSVKIGSNVSAWMCEDIGWMGSCNRFPAGYTNYDLSQQLILGVNMNDKITSIRIDPISYNCEAPGVDQVSIFVDANTDPTHYIADCVVLDPGSYDSSIGNPTSGYQGGGFGLRNDSISAVMNGRFVLSWWYQDLNFSGISTGTHYGENNPTVGIYNDKISSLKVLH